MDVLSVRDYRNNLAASFSRADQGERVLIRPELQKRIDEARKEFAEGKTLHFSDARSAAKWMDEL